MKKLISYRDNKICECDYCEKPFTECDVIKLANTLQKQYNFTMTVVYEANLFDNKTTIDTFKSLPFFLKHLQDCAEKCRKVQTQKTK